MSSTRANVFALAAMVAFLVASFLAGQHLQAERLASEATECLEDMPCWDCSEMGNRTCGPLP